jgi:hypothetical protein
MLLGFKKQFAPFILDGTKTHTIRATRKVSPKPGEICHCYTGLRQKGAQLLGRWPCVRVEEIRFELPPGEMEFTPYDVRVFISGQELSCDEKDALALRDGFRPDASNKFLGPFVAMVDFWSENNSALWKDGSWAGNIIHWEFRAPAFDPTHPKAAKSIP